MNAKSSLMRRIIWMLKRAFRNVRAEQPVQRQPRDSGVFVI